MSRRRQQDRGAEKARPCPVCGGCNRPGGDSCSDCQWDEWYESMDSPDEAIMPNYVSLDEARFIFREFGVEQLNKCNCGGIEAKCLREQYRAIMKERDANNA